MSTSTASNEATVTAAELADRLAAGERITIVDVRGEQAAGVDAASATTLHKPVDEIEADPAGALAELGSPVVTLCNRGITAQRAAKGLRDAGGDAVAVDGGMRSWIAVLQSRPVEAGIDGVTIRQVQRPGRGCLSYVVAAGGEALVVDPAPEPEYYAELAAGLGAQVVEVVDTHIHADHLSGARELAERTGATLRLPAGAVERGIEYADRITPLHDGDVIALGGNDVVRALALPGHTSDMTGLVVGDDVVLSGDSLFADGIARPDLQKGDPEGSKAMARQLHATIHDRILPLGDDTVLLPGHAHPGVKAEAVARTLGEIRAQVDEVRISDPDAFADELVAAMPPRPANYAQVIAVNSGRQPMDRELESGGNSCSTR